MAYGACPKHGNAYPCEVCREEREERERELLLHEKRKPQRPPPKVVDPERK